MASKSTQKCGDESNYINILLLGESGTGKSMFINSFANYLQHSTLIGAEAATKLSCLIPEKFTALTDDGDARVLNFDKVHNVINVNQPFSFSSTQAASAYVFKFEDRMIRLIDTPRINDWRSAITKDRANFEKCLDCIGQFEHLHAICFVLKADHTVLTGAFKQCLVKLLSRLDRSAAANIMFLFTSTRSTNYKAPESLNCVKRVLEEIYAVEGVAIPLKFKDNEHRNCFFFDNEGFKYLVAKEQGVQLGDEERLKESLDVSFLSSWEMITYIIGNAEHPPLPPHNVQDTVSITKARVLILELSQPLADISQLVQDNLEALQRHQKSIQKENLTAAQLKELLYVPVIDLVETHLNQPVTRCRAAKCAKVYTVAGIQKYKYNEQCDTPSDFQLSDFGLTIGCRKCGCNFSYHQQVYYVTCARDSRIEDKTVISQLPTEEEILEKKGEMVKVLNDRALEFRDEHREIANALATFAYYLRKTSVCPSADAYEAFLDWWIENEGMTIGDSSMLQRYKSLKREHQEQKRLLEEAGKIAIQGDIEHISSNQIMEMCERLKKLPHTGKKLDVLHRLVVDLQKTEMVRQAQFVRFADIGIIVDYGAEDLKISIDHCIANGEFNKAIAFMGNFINQVQRNKACNAKDRIDNTKSMVKCLVKHGNMKDAILLIWNYLVHEDNAYAKTNVYNWFVKMLACVALSEPCKRTLDRTDRKIDTAKRRNTMY